ncbi:MAG: arsenate reductase family protein [Thermoplasmatota archaeon]
MGAGITFWGRKGDAATTDAQRFMAAKRYGADHVRDLDAAPPTGADWDTLGKGLGGDLWALVDHRHPRYGELLPRGAEDMDDAALCALLEANPFLIKAPILLTPKGALAGFRERKWMEFLDIGKVRA